MAKKKQFRKKPGQKFKRKQDSGEDDTPKKSGNHKTTKNNRKEEEEEGFEEVSTEVIDQKVFMEDNSDGESDMEEQDTRKLVQKQNRKNKKSGGFQSMGLSYNVYKGVFRKGYKIPTPIQRKTIPLILDGKDVVAMARTGSGKTAAFLIPMFETLKVHSASGTRALILSPTRELALQTLKFTKEIGKFTGLRAAVILGGDSMEEQFAALHESPDIIIATPGRFMHVVMEMDLKLQQMQYVVFDEADRLFEMGFQEQLQEVLARLPESRQTLLFSATLPRLLVDFARAGLHDPTLLRLDVDTKLSQQLQLQFFQCRSEDKTALLLYMLRNVVKPSEQTVVFVATKHHAEYLSMILREAGISSSYSYSALDQTARKINVAKFRTKKTMVLLVTDLAARGIDIPMLDNVINYNFPAKPKLFVHRVGRCARAGQSGTAYSLVGPDEVPYVIDLHLFLGRPVKPAKVNSTTGEDCLYGGVPQTLIDDEEEHLRAWHTRTDLSDQNRVTLNGYRQYIKSRPAPSTESVKRAKEMSERSLPYHPIFGKHEDESTELERQKLLDSMKSYRPNTTIFEINSTKKTSAFSVMKVKRGHHGHVIDQNDRKLTERNAEEEGGIALGESVANDDEDLQATFSRVVAPKAAAETCDPDARKKKQKKRKQPAIDTENYLHYKPKDFQTEKGLSLGTSFEREAAGAVLDLAGDDEKNSRNMKGALKWDRKRKRFIKEDPNDSKNGKKIRTESGKWIPASYKSNIYNEWLEKNKMESQAPAADSDDDEEPGAKQPTVAKGRLRVIGTKQRRGRGIYHVTKPAPQEGKNPNMKGKGAMGKSPQGKPGRAPRRELKNKEEILKKRRTDAKQKAFIASKQRKHKSKSKGRGMKR